MQAFDEVHQAIHYPPDRRFRVWINPWFVFALAVVALAPVAIAWGQYLITGLPTQTFLPSINLENPPTPHGFPAWLRLTHFVNFFFLMFLVRSHDGCLSRPCPVRVRIGLGDRQKVRQRSERERAASIAP
jgi:hypothetical protein